MHDSLAFFRAVYDAFASYRAAIIRLDGLVTANETGKGATVIDRTVEHRRFGASSTTSKSAPRRASRLVDPLDMRLDPGDSLVITGSSGAGKTTLLRSLAQLWPFTSGTLRAAAGRAPCSCPSCRTCRWAICAR